MLVTSLRDRRRESAQLVGWSVLEALPALLSGLLVARAVDDGFLAGRVGVGFGWLALLAGTVVVGAWGTRQAMRRLAALVEPFRDELVTRVVTGALCRAMVPGASTATADVARLTQHVEIVREAYATVLTAVQQFAVVTVGALLGLLTLAPAVLLLVLPPLVLSLGLFVIVLQRMAVQQRASILADERIAEDATVLSGALRDVAACGGQDTISAGVGRHIDGGAAAMAGVSRLTALATVAVALGGWLPLVLILAAGSWAFGAAATTGILVGAITYVLQGLQPALQTLVNGLSGPGLWLMVTLRRIVETTGVPETARSAAPQAEGADRSTGTTAASAGESHELRLSGVSFAYSRWAAPVVRALDLVVPDGDHLAIVGPSGIGKSTLAGLMTGLLQPQRGEVSIGGIPLAQLPAAGLAPRRALIPQEAYVFAGTLRENLTYLCPDAGAAQLDRAVQRLGARALVHRLGGYDADLDPSPLSAGERQLITLVRAYLSPAPLMVLDEATCHLDPATEARVEQAFSQRPGSLVVIAHRISSAQRARRILVLDGTQAMLGEHDELLAASPLYRDLVGHWQGPAATPTR